MSDSKVSIDSAQLFIPTERVTMSGRSSQYAQPMALFEVEILDTRLSSRVIELFEDTGEERAIKNNQPITFDQSGIVTGYRLIKKSIGPTTVTGISLGASAKLLKSDYLQGISNQTINQVFESLIEQRVIAISFSDFIKSNVVMIDLKQDVVQQSIEQAFNEIQSRIKPEIRFKRHSNGNISIGKRLNANNSNLYIKFYDKSQELLTQSSLFNQSHRPDCPSNLLRTEITLHRKHLIEHFGQEYDHSLQSCLTCLEYKGAAIMSTILNDYLNSDSRAPIAANDNTKPDRDAKQVSAIVELLFLVPAYQPATLLDFQEKVISILEPGINKIPKIKRLVESSFYEHTDSDSGIHQFINRGRIVL